MKSIIDKTKVNRVTPEGKHCFFGYYDNSPESPDGTKVLFNTSSFNDRMPDKSDILEVGYRDLKTGIYHKIGETTAWNFQEGCRLQWLNNDEVVYNVRSKMGYCSLIYNIHKENAVREFDRPVYSITSDGRYALTYNFNRNRYCYAHDSEEEKTDYKEDGIFLLNLLNGESKLIISLEKLAVTNNATLYNNWVEHTVFNSSGDHFFFHHRWNDNNGIMQTNFYVSDLDGNLTPLISRGFCSHAGWKNNSVITAWGRLPKGINKAQSVQSPIIRKGLRIALKVYHLLIHSASVRQKLTNDSYVFFDKESGTKYKLEKSDFVSDGHCTWNTQGNLMLTDTYPDSDNMRSLMIYSEEEKEVYLLGKFFSYPDIREKEKYALAGIRCDLHPKWSYNCKRVYFDSTHEGYRALYCVEMDSLGIML